MKKIIIAVFIVIATLGIAAGATAKKAPVKTTSKTTTTKKATSTPKKEVTDPYVGWWYNDDPEYPLILLINVTKNNGKYYSRKYTYSPKAKGQVFCKRYMGGNNDEFEINENFKEGLKRATKEQLETLKYNLENMKGWMKEPCGE